MKVNKSLTTLDLRYKDIGASGGKEIAESLKVNKSLTTLYLSGNNIGIITNYLQANFFYSQALNLISEKKYSADILKLLKMASEIKPFDSEISNLANLSLTEISNIFVSRDNDTSKAKNEEEKYEEDSKLPKQNSSQPPTNQIPFNPSTEKNFQLKTSTKDEEEECKKDKII